MDDLTYNEFLTDLMEIRPGSAVVQLFIMDAPDSGWLDEDDDVRSLSGAATPKVRAMKPTAPARPVKAPTPAAMPRSPEAVAARTAVGSGETRQARTNPERSAGKPGAKAPLQIEAKTPSETRQSAAVRPLFQAPGLASNAGAHTTARAAVTAPVVLTPSLPELPQDTASRKAEPSEKAIAFVHWLQQGLAARVIKYNESGAPVHFTEEGMALVSPLIFKLYARETGLESEAEATGLQVQREVIKAGWHRMGAGQGRSKVNILRYEVLGRGGASVGRLSAIVLMAPDRRVLPVPPANPVLRLMQGN